MPLIQAKSNPPCTPNQFLGARLSSAQSSPSQSGNWHTLSMQTPDAQSASLSQLTSAVHLPSLHVRPPWHWELSLQASPYVPSVGPFGSGSFLGRQLAGGGWFGSAGGQEFAP